MLRPGNPRGIGKAQLGASGFEQPDDAIRIVLLRFAETRPPGAKLIGIFNRPRHVPALLGRAWSSAVVRRSLALERSQPALDCCPCPAFRPYDITEQMRRLFPGTLTCPQGAPRCHAAMRRGCGA